MGELYPFSINLTMPKKAFVQLIAAFIVCFFCFAGIFGASEPVILATLVLSIGSFIFYVRRDRSDFEKRMMDEAKETV